MKKFFLAVFLLISVAAFARTILVVNTSCGIKLTYDTPRDLTRGEMVSIGRTLNNAVCGTPGIVIRMD